MTRSRVETSVIELCDKDLNHADSFSILLGILIGAFASAVMFYAIGYQTGVSDTHDAAIKAGVARYDTSGKIFFWINPAPGAVVCPQ